MTKVGVRIYPTPTEAAEGLRALERARFSIGESCLLVIPAAHAAGGPIATVRMPVRFPLGLHSNRLPTQ